MSAISRLSDSSLAALAGALETGRVGGGGALGVGQFVPAELCAEIGGEIDRWIHAGIAAPQIALVVRAIIAEREHGSSRGPSVELVWTGPEGVTSMSRDTGVVVRELFMSATKSVLVAGFAVHRGREIFGSLAERMTERPDLDVRLFLNIQRAPGDTTIAEHLVRRFCEEFRRRHWPASRYPAVYYDPRSLAMHEKTRTSLHAKCVVIDGRRSFVTSANFTEAAQQRNIEVGALIDDQAFAGAMTEQFDALVRTGGVMRVLLPGE